MMSKKIGTCFNVVGSDWSLHRVISSTLSILHNINASVFTPRLVKGRLTEETKEQQPAQKFDAEKFLRLFNMCYDSLQASRKIREKAHKMMKSMVATHTSATTTSNTALPNLGLEDNKDIKLFAIQYGYLLIPTTTITTTTTTSPATTAARSVPTITTPLATMKERANKALNLPIVPKAPQKTIKKRVSTIRLNVGGDDPPMFTTSFKPKKRKLFEEEKEEENPFDFGKIKQKAAASKKQEDSMARNRRKVKKKSVCFLRCRSRKYIF